MEQRGNRSQLCAAASDLAALLAEIGELGLIHHSDRGGQYGAATPRRTREALQRRVWLKLRSLDAIHRAIYYRLRER